MGKRNKAVLQLILFSLIFTSGVCWADEGSIFSVAGSAGVLIILDTSGSMNFPPGPGIPDSKFTIAKRAIKSLLDANGDGVVNAADEALLGIKMGYMNFYETGYSNMPAERSPRDWRNGKIKVIKEISTSYADINTAVQNQGTFSGGDYGTALADTIAEAKLYFDTSPNCIPRYAIFITDGEDCLACASIWNDWEAKPYRDRKATLAQAKALADAGYKLFVVGLGANMDWYFKNTLEWMAYFGGTKNPSSTQTGNTSAITVSASPCANDPSNDPAPGCSPVWGCQGYPNPMTATQQNVTLSGYAFIAGNENQLRSALQSAMTVIQQARYSFTIASVSANRLPAENFLYEASFKPVDGDPFWAGSLKKYNLNSDGSIGSMVWNAGSVLQAKPSSERNIFTFLHGARADFKCDNPGNWKKYFDVGTGTEACDLMGYIQGEPANNPDGWKLGDIFHSNPITVGSPSDYFIDILSPSAFSTFRANKRTRERIIVAGANDGQFRAFSASNGDEKWSFIPPQSSAQIEIYIPCYPSRLAPPEPSVFGGWTGDGGGRLAGGRGWHQ